MQMLSRFFVFAALSAALPATYAAEVSGKVTLKGTPAPELNLPVANDPFCGKLFAGKDIPKTRFYVVDGNGGLADVFIYIKEGVKEKPAPSSEPVILDQVGCEYTPYVLGLQTNQKLLVKNSDPLMHNVHPTPDPASGNKESNKAQMANSKPFEYVYANPEVFLRFKCDVHPWMFAYVGLVDHPYFAVTGADGTFKIPNLPPGKYTIEAVHRKTHPSGKGISKEITVGADGAKVDFTVDISGN